MTGRRGSVIAQVLVMAAVAGVIAAGVLKLTFSMHLSAHGNLKRLENDLKSRAALNLVNEVWVRTGFCGSDAGAGVTCDGRPCGTCTCTAAGAAMTTAVVGGTCKLLISP